MTPKEQTLEMLAVYEYFGCSGPITKQQIDSFRTKGKTMDNITNAVLTPEQIADLAAGKEVAVSVTVDASEPALAV